MINLTEKPPDIIKMEIKMHLPQMEVLHFLQKNGYTVKAYSYIIPASEEFLTSEPAFAVNTFTATKANEEPSESNLYLKVFEKEVKVFLNSK